MRYSKAQLLDIKMLLSDLDLLILKTIGQLKYARTKHIQNLFFAGRDITAKSAISITSYHLKRLEKKGLIQHALERVGGEDGKSLCYVWHLTEPGFRLLNLGEVSSGEIRRQRFPEPSAMTLRHTLAVADAYVRISTLGKGVKALSVLFLAVEPECWKSYEKYGKSYSLRPDLHLILKNGKFYDHWFIEIDLGTESMTKIVTKCKRYYDYYYTGKEQAENGTFPIILWVVPDEKRKAKITATINDNFHSSKTEKVYASPHISGGRSLPEIFQIITPDQLEQTMVEGANQEELC